MKAVIIYDGSCGLCSGNLVWLKRLDTRGVFDAMPYQDPETFRKFPKLDPRKCEDAMHVVFPDQRIFAGADAFREVFWRMPLMILPAAIMSIPPVPGILRWIYPLIAKYRYKIGGRCKISIKAVNQFESLPARPFWSWLLPLTWIAILFASSALLTPGQRLLAVTVALLWILKFGHALDNGLNRFSGFGYLMYFLWPGIDATAFFKNHRPTKKYLTQVFTGLAGMAASSILLLIACIVVAHPHPYLAGWIGLFALLGLIHLSFSNVLTGIHQAVGFPVDRLFENPFASTSLSDFWSRRWNRAFVEMDRLVIMPLFRPHLSPRTSVFMIFLISGLVHDLAVSYPVQTGWGKPTLYFILQGCLMQVEASLLRIKTWALLPRRLWTCLCILAPVPLLFHSAFRDEFVLRFLNYMKGV